ncbi:MAG: LysR family transcriptional regulator [Gallionella sp.]|nr:LysR family transcriptional regulator [Gallionella sp.]
MDPNWDDFKVLLALMRAGSLAGAARLLGIDHSTVSRRLAAMEEAMGATLILRGGREFSFTPEGLTLFSTAEKLETTIAGAALAIRSAKYEVAGVVRVSCPPGFLPELMRLLPVLRRKHPSLTVEFSGDYRAVDLAKGEADIALRMARPSESSLVMRHACEVGWGIYASSSYAAEHGLPTSVKELSLHRLVLYAETMHNVAALRWMEDYRNTATPVSRIDNLEIGFQLITSGVGIGVTPCFFAARQQELIRVFPEPIEFTTGWIVYHESMRKTARIRAVIGELVGYFESNADLYFGKMS